MIPCKPANFFVLRTPLLAFDRWWSWNCDSTADETSLRQGLRDILSPAFLEALYLASPDLHRSLGGWLEHPEKRRSRTVESSLVAYFSRSADRATPFGLFAGITTGVIAKHSNLELPPQHEYRKKVRLDLRYLDALTARLDDTAETTYRPNTTISQSHEKLRYLEYNIDKETGYRNFRLVDCQWNLPLATALKKAQHGSSRENVVAELAQGPNSVQSARDFIRQLVDAQLLVPDFELELSGDDNLGTLVDHVPELAATVEALSALEREQIGSDVATYGDIERRLPHLESANGSPRFFVDLLKPSSTCSLSEAAAMEVREGVELLRRIVPPAPDALAAFRQSFVDRYGASEVPLLEALDEDSGIALSRFRPALGGDITKGVFRSFHVEAQSWTSYEGNLLRLIACCLNAENQSLELRPSDVALLASSARPSARPEWPSLFAVSATFYAASAEELDSGNFQYTLLGYLSGPALFGRLASADQALRAQMQHWIQREAEEFPDTIFAEILHIPQGESLGQVICRPQFYRFQIPLLAKASVPDEDQIALADLKLSVRAGRLFLRSERLNREVVPRLPVAHNFRKGCNLQLYRFLCEMQNQGSMPSANWAWPLAMQNFPFLPRLTYGRLILCLARWRIELDEIKHLSTIDDPHLMREVSQWRNERRVPRFARLFESNYYIPIDFDNILSVRCFVRSIRRKAFSYIEEMYETGKLCVRSGAETFQHEATIPFTAIDSPRPSTAPSVSGGRYIFPPGSRWVYARIYASPGQTDGILAEHVPRLLQAARDKGLLQKWFFVRYADPEHHLRLRLEAQAGCQSDLSLIVQQHLHGWIPQGVCWRIQFDSYLPEVDRYGGLAGMQIAEEMFCADSAAVMDIIRLKKRPRWLLAMRGIDSILSDFDLSFQHRLAWSTKFRDSFEREFSGSIDSGALGLQHRSHRAQIQEAFREPNPFAVRSEQLRPLANRLTEMQCGDDQMIAHYTHMHVNRIVPINQRQTECVLYHFLCRWYAEQIATLNETKDAH